MSRDRAPTPSLVAAAIRDKTRRRREALHRAHGAELVISPGRNDLLPRLELVERAVAELRPPSRNVRPPDSDHVREIVESVRTLGFSSPVLIDQEGRVVDGWAEVEAARQLGLDRVPCVVIGHLTPAERRVLRIALNRLGEKGSWDFGALKFEIEELVLQDAPIEIVGLSGPELDAILLDEVPEEQETGPIEPDRHAEPIARLGEVYQLGRHRVACGDARDPQLLKLLMCNDVARMVLTDVPYNVQVRGHVTGGQHREFAMASGEMTSEQYLAFNAAWMAAANEHLVDGGVLATFIDWRGYPVVHEAAAGAGLDPLNLVVWSKTNAGMGSLYRSAHELLPLYKKGKSTHVNNVSLGRHGRWRSNVWTYPGASSRGSDAREGLREHPTVKPVAMLEDALLDLTGRGDVVLDPFLGSGSTLIAAEKAGRVCRGIEIDPLYVDLIVRRYEALSAQKAVRVGD